MRQYPSGISGLDPEIGGGLKPGALIAIETDSAGQGDSLLRHLAAQQPTLYISTNRSVENVERWLPDDHLLIDVTQIRVEYTGSDQRVGTVREFLENLDSSVNVMIDPVNKLEAEDEESYIETLHLLKSYLEEHRRVGYLHVERRQGESQGYAPTYRAADMVWKLSLDVTKNTIVTRLAVTKRRGGAIPREPFELCIGESIDVDTSRDISF